MQNTKYINALTTGKVTLKEVVNKLLNIKPSDKDGCQEDAHIAKEFGVYTTIIMHLCGKRSPKCAYFIRTKQKPTPVYIGDNRYWLCPTH
jgi:hypothetical protein